MTIGRIGRTLRYDFTLADVLKNREASRVWLTRECAERLKERCVSIGRYSRYSSSGNGLDSDSVAFREERNANTTLFSGVPKPEHFDRDVAKAGLVKKAGPGAPTFARHSLRHFHSTRLASISVFDLAERQQAMTHRSAAMTEMVYTERSHENFGRKVWRLKPLLPPEFQPDRGGRKQKSGAQNGGNAIDKGGTSRQNVLAKVSPNDQPPSTTSKPAPAHQGEPSQSPVIRGAGFGVLPCGRSDPPLLVQSEVGSSNLPTPIEGPKDPDLNAAFLAVIEAQARLIRALQKERLDAVVRMPQP